MLSKINPRCHLRRLKRYAIHLQGQHSKCSSNINFVTGTFDARLIFKLRVYSATYGEATRAFFTGEPDAFQSHPLLHFR